MVRIRMQRTGRTRRACYRIAVQDERSRRDGRFIEQVGWYDPIAADPARQLSLKEDRIKYWLGVGAQPSDTVRDMLAKRNLGDLKSWEARRARQRDLATRKKEAAPAAPAAPAAGEKKKEG